MTKNNLKRLIQEVLKIVSEIEGNEPNVYYHVTFAKNIPKIKTKGILPKDKSTWKGAFNQDIRNGRGVFVFDNYYDAIKWAFKTSWHFDEKTSIVKIRTTDNDFTTDSHWESTSGFGKWLVKQSKIRLEDIVEIIPFSKDDMTPELTQKISKLSLNRGSTTQ